MSADGDSWPGTVVSVPRREPVNVCDLEVLTVTPTSATITWTTRSTWCGPVPYPLETDTQLWCSASGAPLRLVHDDPTPTAHHRVHLTGLEPGCSYRFRAVSAGVEARPSLRPTRSPTAPEARSQFTTLVPPPGRLLTTIAVTNDIHIGEHRQGIVLGPLPTSVAPTAQQCDYPQMMVGATLQELHAAGYPVLVVNGDITYGNRPEEVATAKQLLDSYGVAGTDWLATRGNHDHPGRTDPFGETFCPYQSLQSLQDSSGLRILGIDSTKGSGGGWIRDDQYEQIRSVLLADPDRPTLVTSHHPATNHAAWSSPSGPGFMLRSRDRIRLQSLEHSAQGVFAHVTGHTHRMKVNRRDIGDRVHHWENAACAAYPGGYTLVQVHEGGFMVNFHRPDDDRVREWMFRSRWQSLSVGAHIMLGSVHDRNHVVLADMSGLHPAGSA